MMMPNMEGSELTKTLRDTDYHLPIPMITTKKSNSQALSSAI